MSHSDSSIVEQKLLKQINVPFIDFPKSKFDFQTNHTKSIFLYTLDHTNMFIAQNDTLAAV